MRNKLIFTIILGMFLISLVSATTTVTLNSPPDNIFSLNNNTFTCSAETNRGYVTNISFYTNKTGTFNLNSYYGITRKSNESFNGTWHNYSETGAGFSNPEFIADYNEATAAYIQLTHTGYGDGSLGYWFSENQSMDWVYFNLTAVQNALENGNLTRIWIEYWDGNSWELTPSSNYIQQVHYFAQNVNQTIWETLGFSRIITKGLRIRFETGNYGVGVNDPKIWIHSLEYGENNMTVLPTITNTTINQDRNKLFNSTPTKSFYETIGTNLINWGCYASNNYSDFDFSVNRTINPVMNIINTIYSPTLYETQQTSYAINISANSSLTSVKLYLNGTPYTPTQSGNIWNYTFGAIPSSKIGNNSVIFGLNYSGTEYNTTTYYQTISPIQFGLCNGTLTVPYWNISFKDENTLSSINGTLQGSTFVYYLGNGTINKTLSYSVSTNSSSYRFCSLPADRPYYVLPDVNYLLTGYPTRIYNPSLLTLTNSTTNTTLYLLNSADGIYVTFITASTSNTPISGVDIEITRVLGGSTTTIFSGLTDSAGSVTIWLNPNYDHTITASKTGYTTNTQTIKPTQSQYTLTMETGLDDYEYVSDRKGLKWFAFPSSGVIKTTNYTLFGYNVSAKNDNLVSCKLELLNSNKTIIITSAEVFATNSTLCSVSINYSMNYSKVKGRLLVDLGDGYKILEDDAYWSLVEYNTTGSTLLDWFRGLDELEVSYFNDDEQHREYTYILLFFLVVMIICASLNRMGWDIQTNGGMIFLVGILIWAASISGFLTLSDISPFAIIDKFFVAIIYTMFMIGFAMRELT